MWVISRHRDRFLKPSLSSPATARFLLVFSARFLAGIIGGGRVRGLRSLSFPAPV